MDTEKQVGSEQQQPQQQTTPNNNLKRPRDEDANVNIYQKIDNENIKEQRSIN